MFRLHFDSVDRRNTEEGQIGHTESRSGITDEITRPWCVDDIDPGSIPIHSADAQPQGDVPLYLLGLVVEDRGPLVNRPHSLAGATYIQQGFGECCLPTPTMAHQGDVANFLGNHLTS